MTLTRSYRNRFIFKSRSNLGGAVQKRGRTLAVADPRKQRKTGAEEVSMVPFPRSVTGVMWAIAVRHRTAHWGKRGRTVGPIRFGWQRGR